MSNAVIADAAISYEDYWVKCEAEDRRHKRAIDKLRLRLKAYQAQCPHNREWTHYEPDPSGNNDSYNECRKCGKQW
jgi:hypothetical protein